MQIWGYDLNDIVLVRVVSYLHDNFTELSLWKTWEFNLRLVSADRALDNTASERKFDLTSRDFTSDHAHEQMAIFIDLWL